jgi:hypothetical protein
MTTCRPDPAAARERTVRAELGRGVPIPERLREALELASGADLAEVRVHDDETADGLAASVQADAMTTGADVFFRATTFRPDSDAGVELLAHEIAHVVQQAGGLQRNASRAAEAEADAFADGFAAGTLPDRPRRHRARRLAARDTLVLQRHSSWEHRMLGDLRAMDFSTIAGGGGHRKAYLEKVQRFLQMWQSDPTSVSADKITKEFAAIRPLRLKGSGLIVTYGELNTLADYLATPAELDSMPAKYLLPILQQVRQEGFSWVSWIMDDNWMQDRLFVGGFEGSVAKTTGWDTADSGWETMQMEAFTKDFGPRGINHYNGLLSRNACHFAPHSWYRWEQFYLRARTLANQAANATGDRKERLTNLAWIHHGYADHFLHDSFAAGHLVNKTLVMQWYLDWVGKAMPVADWDLVQFMTEARQPDLAGRSLYSAFANPTARGDVRDPQTASEHWSLSRRMAVSGVRADGGSTVESSYKRWLAFLSAGVVQLASNTVHDHFNSESLWVSSVAHPQPFQIFGDNTMLKGGDGYRIASETAQLSQQSIVDQLNNIRVEMTPARIAEHFPSKVHEPARLSVNRTLEQWVDNYKGEAGKVFDGFKNLAVGFARTRLAPVNIDHVGGWRWESVPGVASDIAVGGDQVVWAIGAIGADGNGSLYYRDPGASDWKGHSGKGVRIAADTAGSVWLVNAAGYSYRGTRGGSTWERGTLPRVGDVDGLLDIAAGTDGSVWGLAKATAPGGRQLMRCIPGDGNHAWEPIGEVGGAAISVGPDGFPWIVDDAGAVKRGAIDPAGGPNSTRTVWTNMSPEGRRASDIGLGVGTLLHAWITTDQGVHAWNGRLPNQPALNSRFELPWEDMGGRAVRVAAGPDGLPWLVNQAGKVFRLSPGLTAKTEFRTPDAGKVTGTALATTGSLFQDESVSINGSTDLSKVIVGNNDACVYSISLKRSPWVGVFYQLRIDGQGPSDAFGSMYIHFEDEGGFTDSKLFFKHARDTLTIDYNGEKAGIKRISWSPVKNDPGRPS